MKVKVKLWGIPMSVCTCVIAADQPEILSYDRPVVAGGYLMFKHFGDVLGHAHSDDIR